MNSKSLLIAIAAFAVTATGAQAYVGTRTLERAGLTVEQIGALGEARSLRAEGNVKKARDVLIEAGVDEAALAAIKAAALATRTAMQTAVAAGDYGAFREAVADTPLSDIITTEADFELFREAHELRAEGKHDEAQEIMDELGVSEPRGLGKGFGHRHGHGLHGDKPVLSFAQRDALRAARQANDMDTVRAILDEAGERDGWGRW
jgi:hypothetical protein